MMPKFLSTMKKGLKFVEVVILYKLIPKTFSSEILSQNEKMLEEKFSHSLLV